MKDYTLKEKVVYYGKRLNDKSLTEDQRKYAAAFLCGFDTLAGRKLPEVEHFIDNLKKSASELNKRGDITSSVQGYLAVSTQYLKDLQEESR